MEASLNKLITRACILSISLFACSGDTTTGDDASTDGTVTDAPSDASVKDAAKEASSDSGANDAPVDAIDDGASQDAADDAPQDAAVDADDSGAIDAGSIDAGSIDAGSSDAGKKGCLGVFCIIGDTCCNNVQSVDYGKCEPTTCKTCCK